MLLQSLVGLVTFVCLLGPFVSVAVHAVIRNRSSIYHNQFAVHIPDGYSAADYIANRHGFINMGQIGKLKGYYLFEHNHVRKRSLNPSAEHHEKLNSESQVLWVEQQHEKTRKKRDFAGGSPAPFEEYFSGIAPDASRIHQTKYRTVSSNVFPDPLFKEQWYLNGGAKDGLDMNVAPAWQKGYTGKGVVVSILDDGIQTNHPDLAQNYDPLASTDINGNDNDPMPQDNGDNKHGTRCAGEVAAVAFNQFCGIGIAYNASVGGVRMLDGVVNDAVEARALGLNPDHIDIYSASWGPEDDGKTVDGPGPLARRSFIYGVTSGRRGKGSIFVWASGNGGRHTDSCNCDGYTNSIFTLSISSATQGGYKPWYLEECSSTMATTYSSGTPGHDKSVATVDMDGRLRPDHICTVEHTGTSASAPLAAGICALALEANPGLSWRDMQYLVVLTSRAGPLEKENGWITNGVKRKVSHKFGYGLMDASAMVNLAEKWITVPPQHICKTREIVEDRDIDSKFGYSLTLHMNVDGCTNSPNEVRYLEHVQCKITLRFFPRGNLRILLTSPMGTVSTLLFERPRDVVSSNFDDWPFLSVHFWGERASGTWTLQIINGGTRHVNQPGILKKWQLIFYGTNVNPIRLRPGPPAKSQAWKFPLNTITFPSNVEPVTQVNDNYYNPDLFKRFNNFQNSYALSGSEISEQVASLNSKKSTNVADFNGNSVESKVNCHVECDGQGCYGPGPEQCVGCKNRRMDKTCVSECPPRSFSDSQNVCQDCNEACNACTDSDLKSCINCAPGYVKVIDLNFCLPACPQGYFEDYRAKTCISCQHHCSSCDEAPDHCTSCDHHLLLYKNKCLASCPSNTFETDDYTCQSCDSSCETCKGSNSSQCITCPQGHYWHNGSCSKQCPGHTYADAHQRECVQCSPGCAECNKTGCVTCLDDWAVNMKGRCVPPEADKCEQDQYMDQGKCKQCHSTCDTCDGPTDSACLSCSNSLVLEGTKCVGVCPNGLFHDKITEICAPCVHTCANCSSKSNCTECVFGLQLQNGECKTTCANGYYSDKGVCTRCYMSCETCSGPHRDDCVTCPSDWLLFSGECRPDCPEKYFKHDSGCHKCFENCQNCPGCEKLKTSTKSLDVETLLLAQPVSSMQIINPFNFITGILVIGSLCIITIVALIFVLIQKNNADLNNPNKYNKISIKKPKVTCNYKVVSISDDSSDSDSSQGNLTKPSKLSQTKFQRTDC